MIDTPSFIQDFERIRVSFIDAGIPDLREMLVKIIESKDLKLLCQRKSLKV